MDQIIDKLKSSNKYFWFIPKGKRLSLISQGKSKSEVKNNFKLKLTDKIEKYIDTPIIIAKIELPKKINDLIGGPVGISYKFKQVSESGKIKNKDDSRTNVVWFSEDYLLENGFDSKYIINLLTAVYFNKVKIPVLAVNHYDNLKI